MSLEEKGAQWMYESAMLYWCDLLPKECIERAEELMIQDMKLKKSHIKKQKGWREWLKIRDPDDDKIINAIDKMPVCILKKVIKSIYKDEWQPELECCKNYWKKDRIKI